MRTARTSIAPVTYLCLACLSVLALQLAAAQQQQPASGAAKSATTAVATTQAAAAQPKQTAAAGQGGQASSVTPQTGTAKKTTTAQAAVKGATGGAQQKATGGQPAGAAKAQAGKVQAAATQAATTQAVKEQPKATQAATTQAVKEQPKVDAGTAAAAGDATLEQAPAPQKPKQTAQKVAVLTPAEKEKRKAEHRALAKQHAEAVKRKAAAAAAAAAAAMTAPQQPADPQAKEGAALDDAVSAAEKLQLARDSKQATVLSQEIETAPAVQLTSGDGDVSTTDSCRNEVDLFCRDVSPGAGRLALCLRQQERLEEENSAETVNKMSEACKKELLDFNRAIAKNPNANLGLAKACKGSIKKLCRSELPARIMSCLRERFDKLPSKCHDAVFGIAKIQADDYRTDPALYDACKGDVERVCPRAHPKQGRVQACLVRQRASLSITCQEQLFRAEVDNAEDIRLQPKLFRDCLQDKKTFCQEIEPGNARAIECLEKHRDDPGFSPICKKDVDALLAARIKDFRLDPQLKRVCGLDIQTVCGVEKDLLEKVPDTEASVVACLQDNRDELIRPACQQRVKHIMELAASDVRFDVALNNACSAERTSLCKDVQAGRGRIVRCLQTKRDQLSRDCKVMLFDHEVRMGESIDFQIPMKSACTAELQQFCEKVPHENVAAIRCLQDKVEDPQFGAACKAEVQVFEQHISADYRLNRRLDVACHKTIQELCLDACENPKEPEGCGGTVLNCLVQKLGNITNPRCQREVQYYEKMEVRDIHNDMPLAAACQTDVERWCSNIKSGAGRIHECLRAKREELTSRCAEEEAKLEGVQASNVALQPGLARDCAAEREQHCAGVQPGQSRVFNCLIANAREVDFTPKCRSQLMRQQKRRLGNWRLDFNLRTACETDVETHCREATGDEEQTPGAVLQCLADSIGDTHVGCAEETVRALHSGLQFYQPLLPVIKACDKDARRFCTRQLGPKVKSVDIPIGQVSDCLLDHLPDNMEDNVGPPALDIAAAVNFTAPQATEQNPSRRLLQDGNVTAPAEPATVLPEELPTNNAADQPGTTGGVLSSECAALVALGDPKDVYAAYESALGTSLLASQLKKFESTLGLPVGTFVTANKPAEENKAEVLTLTGWSALGAVSALVTLVLVVVVLAIRRCRGDRYSGYQMVMKKPTAGQAEPQ